MRSLKIHNFFYYLSVILIYFALTAVYKFYVGYLFEYQGFITEFEYSRNISSVSILVFIFYACEYLELVSFIKRLTTDLILFFLLIPTLVLWTYKSVSDLYVGIVISVSIFYLLFMKFNIKTIGINTKISKKGLLNLAKLISAISLALLIAFQGINNFNYNFIDLYDFRSARTTLPVFADFLIAFSSQLLLPIILLFGYLEKKNIWVAFVVLFYLLFFLYTNQKTFLFTPILLLSIFFLVSKKINRPVYAITLVVTAISFFEIVILFSRFELPPLFSESTIRRLYFIPNLVNEHYIEYFASEKFYLWSDSKISLGLSKSPSEINMSHAVGAYFYNPNSNANTGFVGSGYGQMGLVGIFIYLVIFSLTVIIIDSRVRNYSNYTIIALFFMPVYTLITSSDLPSIFFSNGLGASILFLFFFKKQLFFEEK